MKGFSGVAAITSAVYLLLAGCTAPGARYASNGHQIETEGDAKLSYRIERITPELLKQSMAAGHRDIEPDGSGVSAMLRGYQYHIGPQDILVVTVWGHPELTLPMGPTHDLSDSGGVVSHDGDFYYPFAGQVHVAGLTAPEVRDLLSQRLAAYIKDPQLDVRVAAFRSQRVEVTGEVREPKIEAITDMPLTLVDAISQAGGAVPTSALERVTVTRGGVTKRYDIEALLQLGDMSQNLLLRDGDVVNVPDNAADVVHMMGEVSHPGDLGIMHGDMNLADAINRAGGFAALTSNPSEVFVFRGKPDKPEVYLLDVTSIDAMLLATQFPLAPQDVVYVSSAPLARWNRIISQILPTVQSLYETKILTNH